MKKFAALTLLLVATSALAEEFTLSWTPPTLRVDGTPYDNPAGYKVYESPEPGGPYVETLDIPDYTVETIIVTRPAGTYYLVMTAYSTTGLESAYSNEVTKVAVAPEPAAPVPPVILID